MNVWENCDKITALTILEKLRNTNMVYSNHLNYVDIFPKTQETINKRGENMNTWEKILEELRKTDVIYSNHLKYAELKELTDERIHIVFPKGRDFAYNLVVNRHNSYFLKVIKQFSNIKELIVSLDTTERIEL